MRVLSFRSCGCFPLKAELLVPRLRPGPLDHVQFQEPWPEAALPRHAGVVTFRLRGGPPRGAQRHWDPAQVPISVNQNGQQVETGSGLGSAAACLA